MPSNILPTDPIIAADIRPHFTFATYAYDFSPAEMKFKLTISRIAFVLVSVKTALAGTDFPSVCVHATGFPPEKYTGCVADPAELSSLTALFAEPPADALPAYLVGILPETVVIFAFY